MADLVVRWMDRLIPVGKMADWTDCYVNEWMIGCCVTEMLDDEYKDCCCLVCMVCWMDQGMT